MHPNRAIRDNRAFGRVLRDYYNDRMRYFPVEATQNGNNQYNDQLPADFTDSYQDTLRNFYKFYLDKVLAFDRERFNQNDQISYNILLRELRMDLEGIDLHLVINNVTMPNIQYMPFNQFEGIPIFFGQMGSGSGIQPFKTAEDYDNWIKRAGQFGAWTDSAIVYFRKGLQNGYILPRCLVEKMIPEMQNMVTAEITKSIFYTPVSILPSDISDTEKVRITNNLSSLIVQIITPSYKKLADFLQNEYLPKSRTSIGFDALPNGIKLYEYLIRYWTTTGKTSEEIYQTGMSEVIRIRAEMNAIKKQNGFKGNL
jgi:uncharacterized protein (DUF885 family)